MAVTVSVLIQQETAAKALLSCFSFKEAKRQIYRRRLIRFGWLLRTALPYSVFFAELHLSHTGRVFYRHSYVADRKFLGPYLSTSLRTTQKLTIQKHFLRFIDDTMKPGSVQRLSKGVCIWRRSPPGEDHQIILRLSDATKFEGDLLLEYLYNGQRLHSLSYVFAPGSVFMLSDEHVAFIGGSQGANGYQSETRAAAKGVGGIHPSNMLVLALRAICQSLDVTALCGVPSRFQLLNHTHQSPREENYDLLWSMNDGTLQDHVYVMPVHLKWDDDAELTGTHRTRRRRRRRLRQDMITEIATRFYFYTTACRPTAEPAVASSL